MASVVQTAVGASCPSISATFSSNITVGNIVVALLAGGDLQSQNPQMDDGSWTHLGGVTANASNLGDTAGISVRAYGKVATASSPTISRQVTNAKICIAVLEIADADLSDIQVVSASHQPDGPMDPGSLTGAGVAVIVGGTTRGTDQKPTGFNHTPPSGWVELTDATIGGTVACSFMAYLAVAPSGSVSTSTTITPNNASQSVGEWAAIAIMFPTPPALAPTANFIGTPLLGTAPLGVVFTDLSSSSPTSWAWSFGDGYGATEQNPVHIYTAAGIYTVGLTATNASGSDVETKTNYVIVYEPSIVDLTNTVCYNGYCFGFTFPAGGGPGQGSYIKRINISEIETVGYEDKRALQDGKDAADVFLGRRSVQIDAAIYGSSRGAAFDELSLMKRAFHPVDAFEEDSTNLGFIPLDFYRPTADIVTWPTSAYPSGIPQRIYCRPAAPVRDSFERERTGGVDEKGLALNPTAFLWARDPRVYLQTSQSIAISTSTTTLTYRGDYESWPIVSFTMTAAGNSACQIVIAGGTVQIDLSATTTGSYQITYADKLITRTSDGTSFSDLFTTTVAQDFRVVRSGSTARVSATTGMSSITVDYREAFV